LASTVEMTPGGSQGPAAGDSRRGK
jgi:hypothetical protein